MTQEEIIKHLHEALNSVDITFPYRYVLVEAIEALSQPSLPDELEEAAERIVVSLVPTFGQKYEDGSYVQGTRDYFSRDELIGLVKAGAEWMAQQGWISVDERLPEMNEEVVVLTDELGTAPIYKIAFGHIVDVEHCIDYNGWNIPGVKYWMPCPEIPNND